MLDATGRNIKPDRMGSWVHRDAKGLLRKMTIVRIMFNENDRELYAIDRNRWFDLDNFDWVGPAKED